DVLAPGSSAAATIRSFSARDQRRRSCTDVITSTVFVIGLALVLVLGLADRTHFCKAALAGSLLRSSSRGRTSTVEGSNETYCAVRWPHSKAQRGGRYDSVAVTGDSKCVRGSRQPGQAAGLTGWLRRVGARPSSRDRGAARVL